MLQNLCAILAVFYSMKWAENVLTFWAGIMVVLSVLMAIGVSSRLNEDKNIQETISKGPALPNWLTLSSDAATMFICASAGWYWLAWSFAIIGSCGAIIYSKENVIKAKELMGEKPFTH